MKPIIELYMTTGLDSKERLDLEWMEKLEITLDTVKTDPQTNHIIDDQDLTTLKRNFEKLFMKTTPLIDSK